MGPSVTILLLKVIVKFTCCVHFTERDCLYPPITSSVQPQAECFNATNSTIFLRWFAPNISMECMDQLVAFPTLNYEVTYRIGSMESSMVRAHFAAKWDILVVFVWGIIHNGTVDSLLTVSHILIVLFSYRWRLHLTEQYN